MNCHCHIIKKYNQETDTQWCSTKLKMNNVKDAHTTESIVVVYIHAANQMIGWD